MNFGEALEAIKQGKRVARNMMMHNGQFVFMQVPSEIKSEIVPRMQSLPQSVKDEFIRRFEDPREQISSIYYGDQLAIVSPCNHITGWSPSASDVLSLDWSILD